MSDEQLRPLPCPYCGCHDITTDQFGVYIRMMCDDCGAAGPGVEAIAVPPEQYEAEMESCQYSAIEIWNNRADVDEEAAIQAKRDEYVCKLEGQLLNTKRHYSILEDDFTEKSKKVVYLERSLAEKEALLTEMSDRVENAEKNARAKFYENDGW